MRHCRRRAQRLRLKRRFSIAGDWRRRPAAAAKPRFQLANQPSEDAIRSKRLVPYEVDSATVAWLLAHNQQLSPPVDQHGVGGKPTALVRPCRHTRSLGVQTDALSLDTSCLLEDFLRSSRAVGLLNSGSGGAAAGAASVSESAGAQSTADAEESAESLRNRCDELAKVNADLKRLLVAALGLDLQAQLDRLSSERAMLSAQLAAGRVSLLPSWPKSAIASASKPTSGAAKFTAGRVMIDELAGWRARLRPAMLGRREPLDLLQERQQLRSDLAD
uniref:CENP-H domain-containing protein n=1 Tax=Macrostomum lignano TaxID=282301 RepID=A0A1I8FBI0_9PLAT